MMDKNNACLLNFQSPMKKNNEIYKIETLSICFAKNETEEKCNFTNIECKIGPKAEIGTVNYTGSL